MSENEQGGVTFGCMKTKCEEEILKAMKPRMGSLLKAIEGLTEEENVIRMSGVEEASRLGTIHSLLEISMKKCVFHNKLMYWPGAGDGDAQAHSDGCLFHHWAECFPIVHPLRLCEAAKAPPRLVAS